MPKLINRDRRIITGVRSPESVYSRPFGLACKTAPGIGNTDNAYSPPLGKSFYLKFMGVWYGGGDPAAICGGTIYISTGTGIPVGEDISTRWEILIPFWAGTTKPAIMVIGQSDYIFWPMNRLFEQKARRFGLRIENGTATNPFWVNVWFEISEG